MKSQFLLAIALLVLSLNACSSQSTKRPDMTGKTVETTVEEEEETTTTDTTNEGESETETEKTIDLGLEGEGSGTVQIEGADEEEATGDSQKCSMRDEECLMRLAEEKKGEIKKRCPRGNKKCIDREMAKELEKVTIKDDEVEVAD